MNPPSSPPPSLPPFLTLPPEIRHQIYTLLLTPTTPNLTIRDFFIRTNFRNVFMSQQPKQICLSVLLVCKQITYEALPVLYGLPLWRCGCRLEGLASQIGWANFGLIRRMGCDADDLGFVVGSLGEDDRDLVGGNGHGGLGDGGGLEEKARLRFTGLEMLQVDGYQTMSLTSVGDMKARVEGLNLCRMVQSILDKHPSLALLAQGEKSTGHGGGDAWDFTTGRVKWRLLRYERDLVHGEHIVDLPGMIELFQTLIEHDEKEDAKKNSLLTRWTSTGVFQQYPYLPQRL